ncbi:karyopherin beta [Ascosphaera acerosa]|nr:karyopherin beta [Ascosphaera acerosa]
MGVIGDIAEAFPQGEFSALFRNDFVSALIREARANRDFSPRTIDTIRWAREQVKRQKTLVPPVAM